MNPGPACLRCGKKLRFGQRRLLDVSPMNDGIFSRTFPVLPASCEGCGRYEFFNPAFVEQNVYLARLLKNDTAE